MNPLDAEGKANRIVWGKYRLNNYNNAVYSEPCTFTNTPHEITSNTIYYNDVTEKSDVIIKPGVTLTVKGNLFMPSEARINVEPSDNIQTTGGGKLIIDGGKITTNCETLWKGVELWGLPEYEQDTRTTGGDLIQGEVIMINGGAIMNAEIGILASKRSGEEGEREYGFTGGHIRVDSGYFVNNKIAVQFDPYTYTNLSLFKQCNFLTTGELLDGSDKQDYFVYLLEINQVRFQGCTFKNTRRDVHYSNRGTGIFSESSGYYILPLCRNTSNPCNDLRKTRFEKLTKGIYSMTSETAPNSYIFINEAEFVDNHMGAYLSAFTGTSNVQILSSTFRNHPYSMWSYGLYLNECSGYHVENNEFYENTTSTPETIGLIVNNSGTSPNEIYRNRFYNLKFATISQNENRNYDPPLHLGGLCYKCNKFIKDESQQEPNRFDFAITYDGAPTNTTGIAKNQGTYLSGTSFAPVGNMFQPYPAASHYDFYNEGNPIDYYYHSQTALPYRLMPKPENIYGTVNPISVNEPFTETSCPSTLSGGGSGENLDKLMEAQNQSDSIGNVLSTLVDGGSTTLLNFDVVTSTPPEAMQVRDELLIESPYLSDTVMKTSVTKEDVLDNAMIRDVLVANPHSAKSEEIINLLENRTIPMPDYMMLQILAGEDTVSAKEILEAKKAWWDGESSKAYSRLLNYYKGDSVIPANEDSLNWLFNYRNTLSSQYDKAGWLHAKGEYSQTDSVLNVIPTSFNLTSTQSAMHDAYLDFYPLSEQIRNDTTGVLRIDSIMALSLQLIANSNTGIPGAYARNILIAAGKITYQEPILLPDTSLKQAKKKKFRGVKEFGNTSILKIFPNPARNYFIVKINITENYFQGLIKLYEGNGKMLQLRAFTGKQDQIVISTANLNSGLYLLILEIDGKQAGRAKVTIIK